MRQLVSGVAVIVIAAMVLAVLGVKEDGTLSDSGLIPTVVDELPTDTEYGEQPTTDGGKYAGDLKDGVRHGKGTYRWPSGQKYVGEWKNGEINGKGIITYQEPDLPKEDPNYRNANKQYEGEFKNGLFDGHGKLSRWNGDTYTGSFASDKFHGPGTWQTHDGRTVKCEYIYGELVSSTP